MFALAGNWTFSKFCEKKNCLINQQDRCPNNIVLGYPVKNICFCFFNCLLRVFLPLPRSLPHRSLVFTFYQVTGPLPNLSSQREEPGDRVEAGFGGRGSWLGMSFLLTWVWVGSTICNLQPRTEQLEHDFDFPRLPFTKLKIAQAFPNCAF